MSSAEGARAQPPMNVDWEAQRAFLAVLEQGSLAAASRALRVMQPTVRRRGEALEREIGAPLFLRSPAGLTPLPLAHELRKPVQAMADAARALERAASAEAGAASGAVRITCSEVLGVEVLPPILAGLRAGHPGLVLGLGLNNRVEDLLRHQADVALRMTRPTQEALVARPVGRVALGLHAHRSVIQTWGAPSCVADLDDLPLIGVETETTGARALQAQGMAWRPERFVYRADSDLAQLAAIRAGVGFGVCQVEVARREPDLQRVLAQAFSYDLDLWVVMHEDQRAVRRVQLVFDALVEAFGAYTGRG